MEEAEWAVQVLKTTGKPVAATLCIGPEGDLNGVSPGDCGVRLVKAGTTRVLRAPVSPPQHPVGGGRLAVAGCHVAVSGLAGVQTHLLFYVLSHNFCKTRLDYYYGLAKTTQHKLPL